MAKVFNNIIIQGNTAVFKNYAHVATTADLDTVGNGVWAYSLGNLLTAGAAGTTTIDGIQLADGDVVLVKDQTAGVENGIYEVSSAGAGSATVLTRYVGLDIGDSAFSASVWVSSGTVNGTQLWVCTNALGSDAVNSAALTFIRSDSIGTLEVARGGTGATSFTSGNVLVGDGTNAITATLAAPSSAFVGISDTQTLTNKSLVDNSTSFVDNADNTKVLQFELSGITTSTTRTLTIPDEDGTIATRTYVDSVAQGLDTKESVVAATTTALGSNASVSADTFNASGGANSNGQWTLTLAVSDTFTVDGVTFSSANNGSRILVKDETSPKSAGNGIWEITISGTTCTLNRPSDFNTDAKVTSGAFTFVEQGTANADSGWVLTTEDPITLGTTEIAWSQFSGAGTITAGAGLTKTGSTLDVGGSATIIANADDIEVNSSGTANQVLLSSGTVGTAATYGALPLGNANAVTGQLGVANGGTGAATLTANGVLYGNGTSAVQATGSAANSVLVTGAGSVPTLSTTLPASLTIPTPIITSYISDANGNEVLSLNSVASAVNNFSLGNTATGVSPQLSVIGDDANIDMRFLAKGTGSYVFGSPNSATAAQLELREASANGTDSVTLAAAASVTASYTLTFPDTVGTTGQVLRAADNSGTLEFATLGSNYSVFSLVNLETTVSNPTNVSIGYMPWDNSLYGSGGANFNAGQCVFWFANMPANRDLIVEIFDGTSIIGTATIAQGTADGIGTFAITNPTSDVLLCGRVRKSANGGGSPDLLGVDLVFTS